MSFNQNTNTYLKELKLSFNKSDLSFLNKLQSAHVAKYSFNNLAVLLGENIKIDSESVFKKIVIEGRGGYCFEHNKLVYDTLQDLGYNVRLLLAKVVSNVEQEAPRTHRITLVNLNNEYYIVDAGFGPLGSIYPIKLALDKVQSQGFYHYRVQQSETKEYSFEIEKNGEFSTLYCFNLKTYTEADCTVSNFYSYQYPEAVFVNNLVVCNKLENDIYSLRNGLFFHITKDNKTEVRITSPSLLQSLLLKHFTINLTIDDCSNLFKKHIQL
ncbi:arylamine N-acetyltransferase family protein [Pseudocolwellia agarivorans]|uniref:arylamine N-acetyltransferase family protein n=1 Tax=Pseudocolwellia agarivorans TaxID=1911682 RepID=UPI000987C943|nr:arylamine N-acetyltransferase [Pseudocolwellia agarivorans]